MHIDFSAIEARWKEKWENEGVYRVTHENNKPKYYVLDMFPYPSGSGLHVGHPLGYIASDIVSRYKRMDGYNVLHPMGYDAFGLPAEQFAIQTGIHPAVSTKTNIDRYRDQLLNLGLSYDWSREVQTSDPKYYKWTQWIFIQLFEHCYNNATAAAMPITDLIAHFQSHGSTGIDVANSQAEEFSAAQWKGMSPAEQDAVLMNYRLAYKKISYVNWCEALGTVLANDEVKDGVSERGGHPVERKAMLQWSLRITAYAERLLNDLNDLDWTDAMKSMQTNWIGRSEGAEMLFSVVNHEEQIRIFTTRPDTIFGVTFMVLAPEHPLVDVITTADQKEAVSKYRDYVSTRSERDRMADVAEVTGEFTGAYAVNPIAETKIPIYIADYVLMDYGTGAIMAVPGDDDRDEKFARRFELPIIEVIDRPEGAEREDKSGILMNSGFLNGLSVPDAISKTLDHLESNELGERRVQYRLRDAIYSRQRYWGEPIPVVTNTDGEHKALDVSELPLELPQLDDFKPSGGTAPLARATDWVNRPDGSVRDTDTMPGYAGSSWYFLRYMDPQNEDAFASQDAVNYWQDVDLYIGGTEHAVGHLMYSRFWHKFLYDKGLVPTNEPFRRLINQGMIQGVIEYVYQYKDKINGKLRFVCATMVSKEDSDSFVRIPVKVDVVKDYGSKDSYLDIESIKGLIEWRPEYANAVFETPQGTYADGVFTSSDQEGEFRLQTESEIGKMGKRYYNAVNPDDVVAEYGADCFRMYEMFLGPIDQSKPWDTNNIDGVSRFIRRFWSLFYSEDDKWIVTDEKPSSESLKVLHYTIKRVRDDIERYSFNTCVSHFMSAVNDLKKQNANQRAIVEPLVQLIAPFAPFLSEQLWSALEKEGSVHHSTYPKHDPALLEESTVTYPVCVNGKKRTEATFAKNAPKEDIESEVLAMDALQKWIDGKPVRKVIVVPGRMVNVVV